MTELIKVHKGKPTPEPYHYWWRDMPLDAKKVCASPMDAVLEVVMKELNIDKMVTLLTAMGIDHASVSRCRHRTQPIQHQWLLRLAIYSGIPYKDLCYVADEEVQYWPHPNAWSKK